MIDSPCIKVCRLTECKTFCLGCWITLEEIRDWKDYVDDAKEDVIYKIKLRKKHYEIL